MKNFKTARLINHMKSTDAMEALGISQPTLSAWEKRREITLHREVRAHGRCV